MDKDTIGIICHLLCATFYTTRRRPRRRQQKHSFLYHTNTYRTNKYRWILNAQCSGVVCLSITEKMYERPLTRRTHPHTRATKQRNCFASLMQCAEAIFIIIMCITGILFEFECVPANSTICYLIIKFQLFNLINLSMHTPYSIYYFSQPSVGCAKNQTFFKLKDSEI